MIFNYTISRGIENELNAEMEAWRKDNKIARIWQKDASVWTASDEDQWLGWLDIVERELAELQKYRDLRADIESSGLTDILLMGMGGSSLCPEVLAKTFGIKNFHILDSTVPAQVKAVESKLSLEKTLFIVASKSGSTLEPNCFKQYFFHRLSLLVGAENAGKQFIGITDPGSKMEQVARKDGFRNIIFGEPTVGGRFSALSPFGLAPAALMGLGVGVLLAQGSAMAAKCQAPNLQSNPGAILGLILGVCHRQGRDKLTIFTSPELSNLGAWLEQLIAESTGKNGIAIIPIDGEPVQSSAADADDRIFVHVMLSGTAPGGDLSQIKSAGHPVIEIEMGDRYDLGAEFFRWEFATAVAGSVMGINPFDQPDVESAKIEARKITEEYEQIGVLPVEHPFFDMDGLKLFSSDEDANRWTNVPGEHELDRILAAFLADISNGDYFAILAYIEMNEENEQLLQQIRQRILVKHNVATCLGFGPRFLHSTGQAYKGGANNGVFLQITSDDREDIPVPGQNYTFGVVKAAQSRGDFQVLLDRGRRALRIHLTGDVSRGLRAVSERI